MQNFGFILASYLSTGLILGVLALWLVLDYKKQKAALQALEARGIRRRSHAATATTTASTASEQVIE